MINKPSAALVAMSLVAVAQPTSAQAEAEAAAANTPPPPLRSPSKNANANKIPPRDKIPLKVREAIAKATEKAAANLIDTPK